VEKFRTEIPSYMARHNVKCGMTGWAQVNGLRGSNTSIPQRIQYDLYYLRNWSMTLDLKIIFLTVFRGLISRNAY
jgi:lipopolysaccharide/colanic/teichoic acid biosynthesis glycosyltransferase